MQNQLNRTGFKNMLAEFILTSVEFLIMASLIASALVLAYAFT